MNQKQEILNYFRILKKNSKLGTSYLFIGQQFLLVFDLMKLISCKIDSSFCNSCWDCKRIGENKHPDLHVIEPEGLTIKIDAIREGIRFLSLKSFRLKNKIVLIKDAQYLSPEAANAFLKTLEEPPKNSFIAICVSKLEGLLPTIISRCRKIFLPSEIQESDSSLIFLVSDFLRGKDVKFKDRKEFSSFLWTLIILLRNSLISKTAFSNNRLSQEGEGEMVLKSYSVVQIDDILKNVLKIYSASNTVNMNLALNMIRIKLKG